MASRRAPDQNPASRRFGLYTAARPCLGFATYCYTLLMGTTESICTRYDALDVPGEMCEMGEMGKLAEVPKAPEGSKVPSRLCCGQALQRAVSR
jgi:hypothetical protein